MSLLLSTLLTSNSSTSNSDSSLIVITDSILVPGLNLLREFINSSVKRQESVVILSLEQGSAKLLPLNTSSLTNVEVIDCISLNSYFASTSTSAPISTIPRHTLVDLESEEGLKQLEIQVLNSIGNVKIGEKVLVVLDSSTRLAEYGVHNVFSLLKKIMKKLKGLPGSRLITVQHHLFPSSPTPLPSLQADLLSTLLSSSLSSATIHLTLHPSSLLELFSREYGLSIPLTPNAPLDLRLNPFLTSFNSRSFGNPLMRPKKSTEEDERIIMDLGGKFEGIGNVVEWSSRGMNWPLGGLKRGESKKFLARGLEGMRTLGDGRIEGVGLNKVLRWESMLSTASKEGIIVPTASVVKPIEAPLPFNLSLTDSQKLAREEVVLPYLPKEGGVEYVPDEGDDMDEDDPDEDLEI